MTHEDQLKAIAYQFITLYERWFEDRQSATKDDNENTANIGTSSD